LDAFRLQRCDETVLARAESWLDAGSAAFAADIVDIVLYNVLE
jgi:hypothetical protein